MATSLHTRILRKNRPRIEALIDNLVELLDTIDPDPDLEPHVDDEDGGDDEYVLGWSEAASRHGNLGAGEDWTEPSGDELDHAGAEDDFSGPGPGKSYAEYQEAQNIRAMTRQALAVLMDTQRQRLLTVTISPRPS